MTSRKSKDIDKFPDLLNRGQSQMRKKMKDCTVSLSILHP